MSGQEDILTSLVKDVAAGNILLHDDRKNLTSRKEIVQAVSSNKLLPIATEVVELIKKKLILPVDEATDEFHIGITLDFLAFNDKLIILGFPLSARQEVARMYYPLFWAMSSDVGSELEAHRQEKGRELSRHEVAYIRVISEWAVANTMGRIEERILRFEPEGGKELQRVLAELIKRNEKLKKKAGFGFQENEVAKVIREVWLPPFRFFREREIKAFLDIKKLLEASPEESRLLWGGHFDFALCDSNSVLQLVVEYNGTGHYGQGEKERKETELRDKVKRSICEKASVPIFVLGSEFAFVDDYKGLLRTLLFVLRTTPGKIPLKFLHDRVEEALNSIGPQQIVTSRNDAARISEFTGRLDIYRIQNRSDMLLALLWEVYFILGKISELGDILNGVKWQISKV